MDETHTYYNELRVRTNHLRTKINEEGIKLNHSYLSNKRMKQKKHIDQYANCQVKKTKTISTVANGNMIKISERGEYLTMIHSHNNNNY